MTKTGSGTSRSLAVLAVFLVVVLGVGFLIGTSFRPGEWYATLEKPPFNPPNWVFGPVWSVIYVFIAIAGWRVYKVLGSKSPQMRVWCVQMVLNWLWTPIWFGLNAPWPAFVVIAFLWFSIVVFIRQTWPYARIASVLFIPYLAWVSFAAVLNFSIAVLN
ncbi:TspO/MBR family protein [Rhizobium sp. L1K21]|uniref:TspO/MBR family protein n=1 Tax=Rhizobium sp. L1K21 TaxID=2954933 RepID=UPI0020922951|nr:TspO/MBR family protein [Rhizobium sp. L1K21]MCO6185820.1 tryptophan-rich sensory protein [Rhizobium sp. L1K21]